MAVYRGRSTWSLGARNDAVRNIAWCAVATIVAAAMYALIAVALSQFFGPHSANPLPPSLTVGLATVLGAFVGGVVLGRMVKSRRPVRWGAALGALLAILLASPTYIVDPSNLPHAEDLRRPNVLTVVSILWVPLALAFLGAIAGVLMNRRRRDNGPDSGA